VAGVPLEVPSVNSRHGQFLTDLNVETGTFECTVSNERREGYLLGRGGGKVEASIEGEEMYSKGSRKLVQLSYNWSYEWINLRQIHIEGSENGVFDFRVEAIRVMK
jgi:hypothetical protein